MNTMVGAARGARTGAGRHAPWRQISAFVSRSISSVTASLGESPS